METKTTYYDDEELLRMEADGEAINLALVRPPTQHERNIRHTARRRGFKQGYFFALKEMLALLPKNEKAKAAYGELIDDLYQRSELSLWCADRYGMQMYEPPPYAQRCGRNKAKQD